MLEYKDDKLGIIKVLNVTEARSHFASMLGDRRSRYIITKNNKPLRAIIDYTEYEFLKNNFGDQLPQTPQAAGPEYPSQTEEEGVTDQEKKIKKSKSRVPGILESHIALSYSTPDKRHRAQPTEGTTHFDQTMNPERSQTFSHEPEEEASVPAKKYFEQEEDYFSSTSADTAQERELIPPVEESLSGTAKPASEEPRAAKPVEVAEKSTPVAEQPKREPKKNKEEEEYFRKYRKLYETLGTGRSVETPDRERAASAETERQGDIENELEPAPGAEAELAELTDSFNQEPHEKETASAATPERSGEGGAPAQKSTPGNAKRQAPGPGRGAGSVRPAQETSEELPSLKDLLASLEQEKLTGEDEEVDESQIEDLIQRITED